MELYAVTTILREMKDGEISAFVKRVRDYEGFVGMAPEYPNGLVIMFETKKAAKSAKKKLGTKMPIRKVKFSLER